MVNGGWLLGMIVRYGGVFMEGVEGVEDVEGVSGEESSLARD